MTEVNDYVESPRTRHRLRPDSSPICGRCRERPRASATQRWCRECRTAYMREWRHWQSMDEKVCAFRDGPTSGVYIVRVGCFVKIGVSSNVVSRSRSIQNANPERVHGVGFIHEPNPGKADALEVALHERFQAHHHRGEWFRLCDDIHAFLRDEAQPWPDASGRQSAAQDGE